MRIGECSECSNDGEENEKLYSCEAVTVVKFHERGVEHLPDEIGFFDVGLVVPP